MKTAFELTRAGERAATIIEQALACSSGAARVRRSLDTVVENVYQLLPAGDYGRGDVRRLIVERLDQVEGAVQ